MGAHKKERSIEFINELKTLGGTLGYHVKLEFPVDNRRTEYKTAIPETPVDIAWFKDENQKFPLFIIEVESVPANGMAFNPMKIFSKSNSAFEKPLFFFHLVLDKGSRSSRIESLKATYETYNYRIYRLADNEDKAFVVDVLNQHRRLQHNIEVVPFFTFLIKSRFFRDCLPNCVQAITQLGYNRTEGMLQEFATLSCLHSDFVPFGIHSVREFLKIDIDEQVVNYRSYIGRTWHFPIHCGIIYCSSSDLYEKDKGFKKIVNWQEKYSHLPMLGPHFGLNSDYDQFLIWGVGGVIGLLSGLFKEINYAREYFCEILVRIIRKTRNEYAIPNLLWLLHIAPETSRGEKYYKFCVAKFKELGSFSLRHSLCPPFLEHDEQFIETFLAEKDQIENLSEFKDKLRLQGNLERDKQEFIKLCFFTLQNTVFYENLNVRIIQYLYKGVS